MHSFRQTIESYEENDSAYPTPREGSDALLIDSSRQMVFGQGREHAIRSNPKDNEDANGPLEEEPERIC